MIQPPTSISHTLARFHIPHMELAHHLGVSGHTLKTWERGNLEMSATAQRLLALLNEAWLNDGYKAPDKFWGPGWEQQ